MLLILASPISLLAQNALTGNIFDNDLRSLSIEGATIKNLTSNAIALSNKDGHFVIPAKVGDLISFAYSGYQTDTVYLINLFPKNVYLRAQVNTLNTVSISTAKLSPYLDLKIPDVRPAKEVDYDKNRGGVRLTFGYGKIGKIFSLFCYEIWFFFRFFGFISFYLEKKIVILSVLISSY